MLGSFLYNVDIGYFMGYWKFGKLWNLRILFFRVGKLQNLIVGFGKLFKVLGKDYGKLWNVKFLKEYEFWMKFCIVKCYDLEGI